MTQEKVREEKLVIVSVRLQKITLDKINDLIDDKKYPNRSEVIRYAIRDSLKNIYGEY